MLLFPLFFHPPSRSVWSVPISSPLPRPLLLQCIPMPPLPGSKVSHLSAWSRPSGSFPAVMLWSGQCLKWISSSHSPSRHPPGSFSSPVSAPLQTCCAPCSEPALGRLDIVSSLPQVTVVLALGWQEHQAGPGSMTGAAAGSVFLPWPRARGLWEIQGLEGVGTDSGCRWGCGAGLFQGPP